LYLSIPIGMDPVKTNEALVYLNNAMISGETSAGAGSSPSYYRKCREAPKQ
jgi:hypothetical protein